MARPVIPRIETLRGDERDGLGPCGPRFGLESQDTLHLCWTFSRPFCPAYEKRQNGQEIFHV